MVDSRTTIGLCVCLGGGDLGVHKCVAKCLATPTFADYTMLNQRITVDLPYSNHISNIFGGKVRPPPLQLYETLPVAVGLLKLYMYKPISFMKCSTTALLKMHTLYSPGSTRCSQLDVQCSDPPLLALYGYVLGSQHSSIGGGLISVCLHLHATSHPGDCFPIGKEKT